MKFRWIFSITALALAPAMAASAAAQQAPAPPVSRTVSAEGNALRTLVGLAAARAPEVRVGRAALVASRAGTLAGRLAPLGNPLLQITADRGQGVTEDVTVDAQLWLPVEISGQGKMRAAEAAGFVGMHEALLAHDRARAMADAVRSFGSLAVAETRYQVVTAIVRDAREEATLYGERLARGDAIARDAAMSAVEMAQNEALLGQARAARLRHASDLRRLTGVVANLPAGTEALPDFAPQRFESIALEQAPLVKVSLAEARYHASARDRWRRDGSSALSVGVLGGRGDLGETRLGAGLAYAFPVFRKNQVESARAEAERVRALEELSVQRDVIKDRVASASAELVELRQALAIIEERALPAAERALTAAVETQRAGKGDWLAVLVSRRDLSALRLRRLDVIESCWLLLGELVELTGELP